MTDHASLRKKMVAEQLQARGVTDPRVLAAAAKVERHRFLSEENQNSAYSDCPLPIGKEQTISQPYMVALMTQALGLKGNETVLEIGTGSGYQTALLAELAKEVYTIERIPELSRKAGGLLTELGYTNIHFKMGDGSVGWKEHAPYDRIIITAACPRVPFPIEEQLKEGGKIVLPVGGEVFRQQLQVCEKKRGSLLASPVCDCVFVPLVGEFGMFKR